MTQNVTTEDYTVEAYGSVTPPPSIEAILCKLSAAAEGKLFLELSPAEVRVLNEFVEAI